MTKNIIEALEEGNKWWKGKFEIKFKPRERYAEVKRFLETRQVIALTGLRRVGKTTIMFKIVEDSIAKDLNPAKIIYFSFDDFNNIRLKDIINNYARLMNQDITKGKYLFLFDEIQKLEGWEEQLKRIYDNYNNFKIIISGSESLFIKKKSKETLAGRLFEFNIKPLNFREFLSFKEIKIDINNILLYKEEILRYFNEYLLCNGFPEIIGADKEVIKKYIKENVIEKLIYKDIPQIFPIKDASILDNIFNIILMDPGEIINLNNLSKELNISRQTISLYLDYLEKSFLIKKLYNFSRNIRKTQRKLKKYYPTIIAPEILEKSEFLGKVFETSLILEMDVDFFWRDTYKNEIDAIKLIDGKPLPIEIKYSKIDAKALKLFLKKFKINEGIILTYDKEEEINLDGKLIKIMPFYKYILHIL